MYHSYLPSQLLPTISICLYVLNANKTTVLRRCLLALPRKEEFKKGKSSLGRRSSRRERAPSEGGVQEGKELPRKEEFKKGKSSLGRRSSRRERAPSEGGVQEGKELPRKEEFKKGRAHSEGGVQEGKELPRKEEFKKGKSSLGRRSSRRERAPSEGGSQGRMGVLLWLPAAQRTLSLSHLLSLSPASGSSTTG
eukprot:gene767-410_t